MDVVASGDGPIDGLRQLSSIRLAEDANLADSLRRVAFAGCGPLPHCAAGSLTLIVTGRPTTMAATNEIASALDDAQYEADDGPCLAAARSERVVRVDSVTQDTTWPIFRRAAREHDIASTLSVPVVIPDAGIFGGFNIHAQTEHAFTAEDEQLITAFAAQAGALVSNAHAYWTAFELTHNLAAAMEHRGVIEQAKGMLMAAHRCSADEAFDMLRRRSQAENRKLRDLAADLVADAQTDLRT